MDGVGVAAAHAHRQVPPVAGSVATTDTTIVVAGGKTQRFRGVCDKVEIFDHGHRRWYTVEPGLPLARRDMSSVVIGGVVHLMGGFFDNSSNATDTISARISSLVRRATSPHGQAAVDDDRESPWTRTRRIPFVECSAAGLLGSLVAVGGARSNGNREVSAVVSRLLLPRGSGGLRVGGAGPDRRTARSEVRVHRGAAFARRDNGHRRIRQRQRKSNGHCVRGEDLSLLMWRCVELELTVQACMHGAYITSCRTSQVLHVLLMGAKAKNFHPVDIERA